MARLVVNLQLKSNVLSESDQKWQSEMSNGAKLDIGISGTKCKVVIIHNTEIEAKELFLTIWELLAWYDGYFYRPVGFYIDGKRHKISELNILKQNRTDLKWVKSALLIGRNKRNFSEELILKYNNIRKQGRKERSMNRSMFSAYFDIISKSYKDINLEHRLVLLMHVCDGFAIQFLGGDENNNGGNLCIMIRQLDKKKYTQGAKLLGVPSSKAMDALGNTRNELTHYNFKDNSFGSYIADINYDTDNMINLYVFYILDLALRVAVLETIGFVVDEEVKKYLLDENLDWIRIEKKIDEDCTIPRNQIIQILEKLQMRLPDV